MGSLVAVAVAGAGAVTVAVSVLSCPVLGASSSS